MTDPSPQPVGLYAAARMATEHSTPPESMLYIVHAAIDRDLAILLRARIKDLVPDLQVFLASKAEEIPTGEDWLAHIHKNLKAATSFLLLLTPRSVDRHWVWYEAGVASSRGCRRLPVTAGGLERAAVHYPLKAAEILDLEQPDASARGESAAHFGPGSGLDRSAIEFGDAAVHLGRPRYVGILVHLGVETLQQRRGEGGARLSRKRERVLQNLCGFAFHRSDFTRPSGSEGPCRRPVANRKPWRHACAKAKVPGKLFHDLRRTAVRIMVRAGVAQTVAMSMSRHKTISVFQRCNVTSSVDQLDALKKTAAHLAAQPKKKQPANVLQMPARTKAVAG